MQRLLRLWMWAWPALAGLAFAAAVMSTRGVTTINLAAFRISIGNPWRPLAVAVILAGVEFVLAARQRRRLVLPSAALVGSFLLAIILIARSAPQVVAVADGAIFELHTRNALHGQQALGAYSQFGWNHPGPLAFYIFAPLYSLGGSSQFALNAAAFTFNILVLTLTIAMAIRYGGGALPVMLAAWLLIYLIRVPEVASSFWNPHFLILPLAALLVACAAVSAGHHRLWPLVAFLSSWVVQAHIGLVPAVIACCGVSVVVSRFSGTGRPSLVTRWLVMLILAGAWALPIADQLINSPGNIRRVAHFFLYEAGPRPLLSTGVKAFAAMTAGVFQPGLYVAQGWAFEPASWWPVVILLAGVPALAVAARTEWRRGDRFTAALGICCLVVIGAGLLSAVSVRGRIGDYQLFWLTVVGAISAAVISTAVARRLVPLPSTVLTYASVAMGAGMLYVSSATFVAIKNYDANGERETVMSLTRDIMDLQRNGYLGRLLIEVDPPVWGVAAGVVLELVRADVRVSVDPLLVRLYGPPFRASGAEDMLLSIAGPARHEEVMKQDGRRLVSTINGVSVSVRRIPPLESFLTVR